MAGQPKGTTQTGSATTTVSYHGNKYFQGERIAQSVASDISKHIKNQSGLWLRGLDGVFYVVLNDKKIPIDFDLNNTALAKLFMDAAHITTTSSTARAAIQRLQVEAAQKSGRIILKRFSSISNDSNRIYVPIEGGQILCISSSGITQWANGANKDNVWVEHPREEPFRFKTANNQKGCDLFEKLLVNTQACVDPALRWLLAMNEALFPYIRDSVPARFITVQHGPSQSGKTSGAERFNHLHGLGSVKGDYTPAAYANLGDEGLLVMDNKEQANLTLELIDLLLFYSTGAERGRSNQSGKMRQQQDRPVVVLTSIEGAYKEELKNRCVTVAYQVPKGATKLKRQSIEGQIKSNRHNICSTLMNVLEEYQRQRLQCPQVDPDESPIPNFSEHFEAVCHLLTAYEKIASKPKGWADQIISEWKRVLVPNEDQEDQSELEALLEHVLRRAEAYPNSYPTTINPLTWQGVAGKIFITTCATLLTALKKEFPTHSGLPKDAGGLGSRLRSDKFKSLAVLDEDNAAEIPELKRTSKKRPVGIFRPDDVNDTQ